MDVDLVKALMLLFHFCLEQENCSQCPIKDFCRKMPCEW